MKIIFCDKFKLNPEDTLTGELIKPPCAIADLHCDLLWYLSLDPSRTPYDDAVRCSVGQLAKGQVKIQILPMYADTAPGSQHSGLAQAEVIKSLPKKYPDVFEPVRSVQQLEREAANGKVGILPAVENASAICGEDEELDFALERLTATQRRIGKLFYVSLTWNFENRFGGGASTRVGLKEDGKRLIDYLAQKNIAIDLSHASDDLAFGILDYIDKKRLQPNVIASHSNMRKVANLPRNLPDDLAKEIIKRKGVIGLNFIRFLVGRDSKANFCRQLEHLLSIGGGASVAFGADFFCADDMNPAYFKPVSDLFFPDVADASAYGVVIEQWRRELGIPEEVIEDICCRNFARFAALALC